MAASKTTKMPMRLLGNRLPMKAPTQAFPAMKKIGKFKVHPAANYFPLMGDQEFEVLVADIEDKGQSEPVVLLDDAILDGRNRARACERLGIKPKTKQYKGDDPVGYVVSLNLARRHLDESQRAMAAARITDATHGGDRRSKGTSAPRTRKASAELLNTSVRSISHAKRVLSKGVPELQAAVDAGDVSVKLASELVDRTKAQQRKFVKDVKKGKAAPKVNRELRRKDREKKMSAIKKGNKKLRTDGQYGVIYADPSWMYDEGTTTPNRRIDNHYPPMPLDQICALPVPHIAMADAVLFLWVPVPLIFSHAKPVLDAWGFEYRSQAIWDKEAQGMGYWAEVRHEILIIAKKGDAPPPEPKLRMRSVISHPRGEHSAKPAIFREIIRTMYPDAARIELFAREQAEGWDAWGNQAPDGKEFAK